MSIENKDLTPEEKNQIVLVMSILGITSNRNISEYYGDYPKASRDILKKAREYQEEIKLDVRENTSVYLKEIKRIAQFYADCINGSLDNDMQIIVKDIEKIEAAYSYQLLNM